MRGHAVPRPFLFSFILSILSLLSISAKAFPELIRHGYVNCITCHVSPSGGGALNDYGRTFSGEGLSTWTTKNEESVFEGLIKRDEIPKWLSIGGDVRGVQTFAQDAAVRQGHYYWMQADVEAAARVHRFTLDVTLGRFQTALEEPRLKSRRFFAMYNFTDEWMVRTGRFLPVYGLNLPDHIISTRMPLNFDQGQERYNVELSHITDRWSEVLTFSQGPADFGSTLQENSVEAQVAQAFHDTYKVGLSGWWGRYNNIQHNLAGAFANFGLTEDLVFISEFDWQWLTPSSNVTQLGFFTFNRLGYEVFKGVNLLATGEFWQTDLSDTSTAVDRYGIGTELFPRPHFDFQLMYTKQRIRGTGMDFADYAWLMLHYYL